MFKNKQKEKLVDMEFVPYQLALKLKKLNFNYKCLAYFDSRENLKYCNDLAFNDNDHIGYHFNLLNIFHIKSSKEKYCTAPTYDQVVNWIRKEYDIVISINANSLSRFYSMCPLCDKYGCMISVTPYKVFKNYNDCLENAINEVLNFISKENAISNKEK